MIEIRKTKAFTDWVSGLRDLNVIARIDVRIRRLSLGNPGDVKAVGEGVSVSELRIDYGIGFRVYYTKQGAAFVILLCGGSKKTQAQDIKAARKLAKEL